VSWTLYQPHATYSIDEGELAGAQASIAEFSKSQAFRKLLKAAPS